MMLDAHPERRGKELAMQRAKGRTYSLWEAVFPKAPEWAKATRWKKTCVAGVQSLRGKPDKLLLCSPGLPELMILMPQPLEC